MEIPREHFTGETIAFNDIVEALVTAGGGQEAVERVYLHEPASTHAYLTCADRRRAMGLGDSPIFEFRGRTWATLAR